MPRLRQQILAFGTLLLALSGAAQACQICVPFPKDSAADHLLAARTVVLARENPDKPFSYTPTEILKGKVSSEVDLFLDSSTRRMLAAYPERSVVLVELPEGEKSQWRRIGTSNAEVETVLRNVLESGAVWKKEPSSRVDFFASLLGHDDPQLRTLAHLEVGRAPYAKIRQLGDVLTREEICSFLKNYRYAEWHPLYILLLAQSPEAEDRETIAKAFRSAARFGTTDRLAAWTTAWIEVGGTSALEEIEQRFFKHAGRTAEELKEIVRALSVQGTNSPNEVRDRIVESYGLLLANYPAFTPQVAKDLIAWKRTELSEHIGGFESKNRRSLDFQTSMRLRNYARDAKSNIAQVR